MAKVYYLTFSPTDPRSFPGLSPTMLIFNNNGTAVTPPAIGAVAGATGVYSFTWGTTTPIFFLADAATTGPGSGRYVQGSIDPADRSDEYGTSLVAQGLTTLGYGVSIYALEQFTGTTLVGVGNTSIALGNTILAVAGVGNSLAGAIGSTASLIGDNVTDPGTLFGYLKRVAELLQGAEQFVKGTGVFTMYDRTGATLLNSKTIANSASLVTRT